jgi:imidazoleglycerol-phosphate dehydratase
VPRIGRVERSTKETAVQCTVDLDGGQAEIATGIPFFDHMLEQLARHGHVGLTLKATGDLQVDAHHTVEDVGIVLGQAILEALGDKKGIRRYADARVPMEEALASVAIDISGRPLLVYEADIPAEMIGQYESGLTEEFMQALCRASGLTAHIKLEYGRNAHHATEAIFKAFARALGDAIALDPRGGDDVPSTKGVL